MKQYDITGMSCAACSARIEKAVSKVEGVENCSVNLLTNSMAVEGNVSEEDIVKAVTLAGYGAKAKDKNQNKSAKDNSNDESFKDKDSPLLLKRLISSIIFLLPLMYVSMWHMMWKWPLPSFFINNPIAIGLYELLLALIVMIINQKFFISGFKSLLHRAPNMDTLVALGSSASFIYSTVNLFIMTKVEFSSNHDLIMQYLDNFYFEAAAMILTLITVGKLLEARSKGKTTNALKSLIQLKPKTAHILKNDVEESVSVDQLSPGDIFLVYPGESIPVDGIILEGNAAIDEAALTGESIPVDKSKGDQVSAATINQSGFIKCKASRVGEDTTLSQIIKMVSDAAATKAPIAKIADKVSGIFVPTVIIIALITFAVWAFLGADVGSALTRAVAVLVISCPCALGLATPVAIMVGNGKAARNGILFKNSVSLENAGKSKIVVLDKTGTITKGNPLVTEIISLSAKSEKEVLEYAAALESKSEHPLAKAILAKAKEENISILPAEDFKNITGSGLYGKVNGKEIIAGNLRFIESRLSVDQAIKNKAEELSLQGKTPLFFAFDNILTGIICVEDTIKEDSPLAISLLKKMKIRSVMLTGDNEKTARVIAKKAGIDEVIANVMPDGKEEAVKKLQKEGKVCMVGDGINDAPALTRADTGMAIGAGTDIAIEAADVVLVKNSLMDMVSAITISRQTLKNIKENLFWAFIYNIIGIPLAAGVFTPLLGWKLNPMFGALAMSLSSFCVVTNALRLNFIKLNRRNSKNQINNVTKTEHINTNSNDKESKMKVLIEGMMCQHCENHVKSALEALPFVESAQASHTDKCALINLKADSKADEEAIKKAVTDAGYEYKGIEG